MSKNKNKKKHNHPHRARAHAAPELPKFWQPKLSEKQKLDCQLVHWDLITRFTSCAADGADLWDWMETGFTYRKFMDLLTEDGVEFTPEASAAIAPQLAIYEDVAHRFAHTGRARFSGPELQIAEAAATVFDELVQLDRHGFARTAALWSIQQMAALLAEGLDKFDAIAQVRQEARSAPWSLPN